MKRPRKKIQYGGVQFGKAEKRAINAVLKRNWWGLDKEARLFEQELADYTGTKYCTLTNSGSSAALIAMASLELPPGSEVIISATTFPTVFNAILHNNLVPVVVDPDLTTYNIDPDTIKNAISPKTKAVWAVHVMGNACDMPKIVKIAKKNGLTVLQDNCEGFGSRINERKVESHGDISITSFHAAHIVAMGEGGGLFINDTALAKSSKMYRDWGNGSWADKDKAQKKRYFPSIPKDYTPSYIYEKIGYNLKPLELQAAMGRVQLKKIDMFKKIRQENFTMLHDGLKKYEPLLKLPNSIPGADICWFAFPLTVSNGVKREAITSFLESNNIETRSMLAGNITKQPAYKKSRYRISGTLKNADRILRDSFFIGLHPGISKREIVYILSIFDSFFKQH